MKKLALTVVIVLGMTLGAFAQDGGLFGLGQKESNYYNYNNEYNSRGDVSGLLFPDQHGFGGDVNSTTGATVPVGSGIAVLIGLGAAYAVSKRRKK